MEKNSFCHFFGGAEFLFIIEYLLLNSCCLCLSNNDIILLEIYPTHVVTSSDIFRK